MNAVLEKLSKIGIVPVVKIDRAEDAVPLARALCAGGLPCAEVTFRTDAAAAAIKAMTENFPDMCVGAGTVLNAAQVDAAVEAGAQFIVSPGLNPRTVQYCLDKNVPITPGTSSPSDIEQAIELGLDVVKFFPAEQSGGLAKIKAMAAPYVNMKFMPTGGINAKNLTSYLDFNKIIACGGSWMVPGDLINAGEWDRIDQLTRGVLRYQRRQRRGGGEDCQTFLLYLWHAGKGGQQFRICGDGGGGIQDSLSGRARPYRHPDQLYRQSRELSHQCAGRGDR